MTEALAKAEDSIHAVSAEDSRRLYRLMRRISSVDERTNIEVRSGRLKAATYPVRGLEASCAALGVSMQAGDRLISTYRNLGDAIAKGASLDGMIAEIFGRADGVSKGKGGAMHLHDPAVGFITSTGVVGSGLPIAVGVGLALQLAGEASAAVATFGDGATAIGAFHEAMNMAALWNLPVVFVCQNNGWAEHTAIAEHAASTDLAGRAESYGMRAVKVDGFDPVAAVGEFRGALTRAREGLGPTFVEVLTYRLTGHSGASDYSYVPQDELAAALERDPLPRFRELLMDEGVVDETELARIDEEVRLEVEQAFASAIAGAGPSQAERYSDVFADPEVVRAL